MTFGGFLVISEVCLLPGALTQQHTAYFFFRYKSECVATPVSMTHTHTPLRFFLCVAWDPGPAGYEFVRQNVYSLWRGTVGGGGFGPFTHPAECYCLVTCKGNGNNGSCAKRDSQQNLI